MRISGNVQAKPIDFAYVARPLFLLPLIIAFPSLDHKSTTTDVALKIKFTFFKLIKLNFRLKFIFGKSDVFKLVEFVVGDVQDFNSSRCTKRNTSY